MVSPKSADINPILLMTSYKPIAVRCGTKASPKIGREVLMDDLRTTSDYCTR